MGDPTTEPLIEGIFNQDSGRSSFWTEKSLQRPWQRWERSRLGWTH